MSHEDDLRWMRKAIDLSRQCPPSQRAFSVGAIIVDTEGNEIASGYSRETDPKVHAEESALAKLARNDSRLENATLYSTLEPCTQRKSRPLPCAELILRAGIPRVVIAWREPDLFVTNCAGVETLRGGEVPVTELSELSQDARSVNSHVLGDRK